MYKSAVIGCGRIGSTFDDDDKRKIVSSHCGAYSSHYQTNLTSVCDLDKSKAIKAHRTWKTESYYSDYKEMLKYEKIDILSVCTYPETHEEIIEYAIKHNVKAIFCEKPIAHNLDSANKIIKMCEQSNTLITINHFRRWDEFFINLKNQISQKYYGDIQHINFNYTRGVANTGSHLFDLLRFLFGDVKSLFSIKKVDDFHNDPTLTLVLTFQNGMNCNMVGFNGNNFRIFELEIFSDKYRLTIDTSKQIVLYKALPSKRSSEFNELYKKEIVNVNFNSTQPFEASITNIIESIEKKATLNCSAKDGLKSLELIVSSKLSFKEKRRINIPINKRHYNIKI